MGNIQINNLSYNMVEQNNIPYLDRMVSVYNNVYGKEKREIKLREFLFCMSEKHKEQIMRMRSCGDKDVRVQLKKQLPQATISGVFLGPRKAEEQTYHNGLLCVDIDKKDNPGVTNFENLKENILSRFEEILYAAHSVSGEGYFAIIPLKYPKLHVRQFRHLEQAFAKLGIIIDHNCSDVSRLRCISYDFAPYVNENAIPYDGVYEEPKPSFRPVNRRNFVDDTDERVFMACEEIKRRHTDMTDNYADWVSIGLALASLGEQGRDYFHIVSEQNPKYDQHETDKKFDGFLRSSSRITIGTFFHYCKMHRVL